MTEYTVEFRLFGESLDPNEVTAGLGLNPSLVRQPGEKVGPKTFREGLWAYSGGEPGPAVKWTSLNEGLLDVINRLMPVKQEILRYARKYKLIFWCGVFSEDSNSSVALSPACLSTMSEFGAELFIDFYNSTDDQGG